MSKNSKGPQGDAGIAPLNKEEVREALAGFSFPAAGKTVNRTRRVIRERAVIMEARQSKIRSLVIPLSVCGGLLAIIFFAVWSVLDQYELAPTGLPDATQQMLVLLMWCLPLTGALLAIVWFRRGVTKHEHGSSR